MKSRLSPREQKLMEYAMSAAAASDNDTANTYSRIAIEIAIARLGKYAALEAWLKSVEIAPDYTAFTAWKSAQVIRDDFAGFEQYKTAALEALGIDAETAEQILAECKAT